MITENTAVVRIFSWYVTWKASEYLCILYQLSRQRLSEHDTWNVAASRWVRATTSRLFCRV